MRKPTARAMAQNPSLRPFLLFSIVFLLILLLNHSPSSAAEGPACTGKACGDIVASHVGLAMQFQNQGGKSIVLSISKSVGMPNGCSTPVAYTLAAGDKQLIKGHICPPYNASYN